MIFRSRLAVWVAIITFGVAAGLVAGDHRADWTLSIVLLISGLFALLNAQWRAGSLEASRHVLPSPPIAIRWWGVWGGIALLAAITQVNVLNPERLGIFSEALGGLVSLSPHLQVGFFVLAILLIVWGLGGGWHRGKGFQIQRRHGVLLVIVVVAFIARLWNLEEGIYRLLDEAHYAQGVVELRQASDVKIFHPFGHLTAFSWLYPYMQLFTAEVAGSNFTGLRLASAIVGTLNVSAVYFLGKTLFDRKIALVAAALLATFPLHIHFSRIGINNIVDPLIGTLMMAFLVRGLRSGRQMDFALAGVLVGLTQYFYEGGRLFFPVFVVAWLGWMILLGKRSDNFQRPSVRNVVIFVFGVLCLIIPFYFTWWMEGFPFMPRYEETTQANLDWAAILSESDSPQVLLLEHFTKPLRGYIQLPETGWFYGGNNAIILPLLVPAFLLGTGYALNKIRQPTGALLFWWMFSVAMANNLIADNLSAPRYLLVLPVLALLIAWGGIKTTHLLIAHQRRKVVIVLLGLAASAYQLNYYFGIHLPGYYRDQIYDYSDSEGRLRDSHAAFLAALQLPPFTHAHIVSRSIIWDFDIQAMLDYMGRNDIKITHVRPSFFNEGYLNRQANNWNFAFYISPDNLDAYLLIDEMFDIDGPFLLPERIPPEKQLWMYFAPLERNLLPGQKHIRMRSYVVKIL